MSLLNKLKRDIKPYKKSLVSGALGVATGLTALIGDSANAEPAPPVRWSSYGVDTNGVFHFTATNLVPGKFYAAGMTPDPSGKFYLAMQDLFQAPSEEFTFYTLAKYEQAFVTLIPVETPETSFNIPYGEVVSNKVNVVSTTTNVPIIDNHLWLYHTFYNDLVHVNDGSSNVISAELDTRTLVNGWYDLMAWQKVPGPAIIEGLEFLWWNNNTTLGVENPFYSIYPLTHISSQNFSPAFNFVGETNTEYRVKLSSVGFDGVTNLLGEAIVDKTASATNEGFFSVVWDRSNDPLTPSYRLNVTSPSGNAALGETNVLDVMIGCIRIKPMNTWLHSEEKLISFPFESAFNHVYNYHSEASGVIENRFPLSWDPYLYLETQTRHPQSPFIIQGIDDIPRLLNYITITNNPSDNRWVSYFTIFAHMNEEEMIGGGGSAVGDAQGLNYHQLAAARGTTLLNNEYLALSYGAMDGVFLEGCESSAKGGKMMKALGVPRIDYKVFAPNFGQGQWTPVPAVRAWVLAKRNTRIIESFTGENMPTIADAITANQYYYPELIPFINFFGCPHKIYPRAGNISGDIGYHSAPSYEFFGDVPLNPPVSTNSPNANGSNALFLEPFPSKRR